MHVIGQNRTRATDKLYVFLLEHIALATYMSRVGWKRKYAPYVTKAGNTTFDCVYRVCIVSILSREITNYAYVTMILSKPSYTHMRVLADNTCL